MGLINNFNRINVVIIDLPVLVICLGFEAVEAAPSFPLEQ